MCNSTDAIASNNTNEQSENSHNEADKKKLIKLTNYKCHQIIWLTLQVTRTNMLGHFVASKAEQISNRYLHW